MVDEGVLKGVTNIPEAALIFDYGDWRTLGDTLQAVKEHQPTDPLSDPGGADLTAHVDFEALATACAPCTAVVSHGQSLSGHGADTKSPVSLGGCPGKVSAESGRSQ